MKPIITGEEQQSIHKILFGQDPRILRVLKGSIAIDRETVDLTFKGPPSLRIATSLIVKQQGWAVGMSIAVLAILLLLLAPLFLNSALALAAFGILYSLPLIFILNNHWWPHHMTVPKSAIAGVYPAGHQIIMLFKEAVAPIQGLQFYIEDDADILALEHALSSSGGTLPTPIFFVSSIGAIPLPNSGQGWSKKDLLCDFAKHGTLTLSSGAVELTGAVKQQNRFSIRPSIPGLILITIFIFLMLLNQSLNILFLKEWSLGIGLLCYVPAIFFLLRGMRDTYTPDHVIIPRDSIHDIRYAGNPVTFQTAIDGGNKRVYFYAIAEEESEAIASALAAMHPGNITFSIKHSPSIWIEQPFFGAGYLMVTDTDIAFEARRRDTRPNSRIMLYWALLLYLGSASLLYWLYPVVFEPLLEVQFKGLLILILPFFVLICAYLVVRMLASLCIRQQLTFSKYSIRHFRRLDNQLSFVTTDGDEFQRYDFFTTTEEEAKAIEEAMANK